jgi:hypothetical protein
MSGELITTLIILFHLLRVDVADLSKLVLVVRVLDGRGVCTDLGRCLGLVGAWKA